MVNAQFEKLEKINEYAKTFGITIYRIDYGFIEGNEERIHSVAGVNELSDRYYNFIGRMNQCKKDLEK